MFFLQANDNASKEIANSRTAAISAVGMNARLVTERISDLTVADELARELSRGDLTYANIDARLEVTKAREAAVKEQKILMITFGANWCMDCRNLHRRLKSGDVKKYTEDRFLFVNVDVGKFNQNADLAKELGVTLAKGIPVAIFFNPDGEVIGTTNEGQLEPARRYTSKQILRFVRDIAERSQITTPNSVSG